MTIFRSTTDEMLAARFDPEPWVDPDGTRHVTGGWSSAYAPRPEFIPSRDPEPYISTRGTRTSMALEGDKFWRWSPRPEYARSEPNPILADFRNSVKGDAASLARNWLGLMEEDPDMSEYVVWAPIRNPLPEHIEHARKVLTRLVSIYSKED